MRKILILLFCFSTISLTKANNGNSAGGVNLNTCKQSIEGINGAQPDSIAPDSSKMGTYTSVEVTSEMIPGWNIGNSLDAIGGETKWGNPLITQTLIDSVKAAGFKSIRIPVAWSNFSDASTYTIDTNFMNRVEEVVNYVLKDSLYAIINIHWDGGWMNDPVYTSQDAINNRLAIMWKQIAVHFRDYGFHLMFAGTNEVHIEGSYSSPTVENLAVQNSFNHTFVNTVRATGGRNYFRYIIAQGYNTNIGYTVSGFTIPGDVREGRLLVEAHYYDPYNFTINSGSTTITQWGKYADDPGKTETWANESYADDQFNKMKTNFVDKGYGVIIGEYGAMARLNLGSAGLNEEHAKYREYYLAYITRSIANHNLVPMYWDNGGTGNNGLGLFDRNSGAHAYPDAIRAIVDTSFTVDFTKPSSGINNLSTRDDKLVFFPNPAKNVLYLRSGLSDEKSCSLFTISGQFIRKFDIRPGLNSFDISNLNPGCYFIKTTLPENILIQKFVKD